MVLLTVVYVAVIAIMALVVLRRGTDDRVHATGVMFLIAGLAGRKAAASPA